VQILFCSTAADGSGTNLFVVSPDGKNLTQLTHDHGSLCQAAWSPDGSQIALISDRGGKQTGQLYVMNANGTNLHLAADVINASGPVWSPDGNTLLFSGLDRTGSGAGMYRASPNGFGLIQLIKNPAFEAEMQWSPDGKKIVYQADSSLYMINPDSSGQVKILPKQTGMGGEAWSPDGSWIAFDANPAGDSQIFVSTIDGSTLLYYAHPGLQDLFPLFSPDGKKLIFYSHHDHVDDGALLLITFDNLSLWGK
jgi:Tol biopolymer transport system component